MSSGDTDLLMAISKGISMAKGEFLKETRWVLIRFRYGRQPKMTHGQLWEVNNR